jgi:hypothetical protein
MIRVKRRQSHLGADGSGRQSQHGKKDDDAHAA